jgi:hypothetical protein
MKIEIEKLAKSTDKFCIIIFIENTFFLPFAFDARQNVLSFHIQNDPAGHIR